MAWSVAAQVVHPSRGWSLVGTVRLLCTGYSTNRYQPVRSWALCWWCIRHAGGHQRGPRWLAVAHPSCGWSRSHRSVACVCYNTNRWQLAQQRLLHGWCIRHAVGHRWALSVAAQMVHPLRGWSSVGAGSLASGAPARQVVVSIHSLTPVASPPGDKWFNICLLRIWCTRHAGGHM